MSTSDLCFIPWQILSQGVTNYFNYQMQSPGRVEQHVCMTCSTFMAPIFALRVAACNIRWSDNIRWAKCQWWHALKTNGLNTATSSHCYSCCSVVEESRCSRKLVALILIGVASLTDRTGEGGADHLHLEQRSKRSKRPAHFITTKKNMASAEAKLIDWHLKGWGHGKILSRIKICIVTKFFSIFL